jgi:hypothetical protein
MWQQKKFINFKRYNELDLFKKFICTHSRIHCPENARECQNGLIMMLSKREKEEREREIWQQSAKYLNLLKEKAEKIL